MRYGPALVIALAILFGANDIAKAIRAAQINLVIKMIDEIKKVDGKVNI